MANRIGIVMVMLMALAGCADNPASGHHGPPPHDPPDYHGVPTDDRPPMMLDAVPPPAQ